MNFLKRLWNNIYSQRKNLILHEELTIKVKVHITYIGEVECGEKNIAFENLYKISKSFNIPVIELTSGIMYCEK